MDIIRAEREILKSKLSVETEDIFRYFRNEMNNPTIDRTHLIFQFWYNQVTMKGGKISLSGVMAVELLLKSRPVLIDGYSHAAAIIIGEYSPKLRKEINLQHLKHYGYVPNEKDIQLSKLMFYDNIPNHIKQNLIIFSLEFNSDIKRYIIAFLIDMLDIEYGLKF